MLGIQWNFLRIIRFIADILVTFPLASDLFLKIPPSRKITNNSGIYTYWGGNMSREGTARGKINNFSEAPRCIVFSKKRGHWCIHFLGKYWFFLEILLVVRYLTELFFFRAPKFTEKPLVTDSILWPRDFLLNLSLKSDSKLDSSLTPLETHSTQECS